VLTSLLAAFLLFACSPEKVHRPDNDEDPGEGIRASDVGPFPCDRGVEAVPVARTDGRVYVERAVLSSAGDADLVQARVGCPGSWVWPRCSLLEGPDVEAIHETIESRKLPRAQGYTRPLWEESLRRKHESPWADRSTIEKSLQDDGTVICVFHEDPKPEGEAADLRRTPFFVRCVGGDPPDVVRDVAHVLGTSGAAS